MNKYIKLILGIVVVIGGLILGVACLKNNDEVVIYDNADKDVLVAKADNAYTLSNNDTTDAKDGVRREPDAKLEAPKVLDNNTTLAVEDREVTTQIIVHVCGQVNSPGVYELEYGSRVYEAIDKAGGLTKDAAADYVNQADVILDGSKLYIPSNEEAMNVKAKNDGSSSDVNKTSVVYGLSIGENKAEDTNMASGVAISDKIVVTDLVNINTASKEELMTLKGVGESKALKIISYRESCGGFRTIEEIMNIPGIKEGLFNKIKDQITV